MYARPLTGGGTLDGTDHSPYNSTLLPSTGLREHEAGHAESSGPDRHDVMLRDVSATEVVHLF